MRPATKSAIAVLGFVVAGAGLVSCGGSPKPAAAVVTSDGTTHVTLIANDSMRFVPSRVTVPPGPVDVTMQVEGTVAHDIDFPELNLASPIIQPNHSTTLHFIAKAGHTYDFECELHLTDGMIGSIHVT